ncbi:MAG TPA: DUF4388 domain-containing protein [Acidimicrobiia bacterium]
MSLSGNLATFSLDEVLLLLSRTAKSGALRVRDATTEGVVYFTAGRLCGAEVDQVSGAVDDVTALEARLVDACFALARLADGAFEFETDRRPPWTATDEVEVTPVVERVRDLLARWPAIERSVPSVDVAPRLAEALHRDSVTIDRATWPILVAVDGRSSVRAIGTTLGRSALEIAASLAVLVEAGAVTVDGADTHAPEVRPPEPWRGLDDGFDDGFDAAPAAEEITDLESQVDALEQAAAELDHDHDDRDHHDHGFDVVGGNDGVASDALGPDTSDAVAELTTGFTADLGVEPADEPVELPALTSDGVAMLTHDPDALALLNRAELERAALGEPIEEPEPEAGADPSEPAGELDGDGTADRGSSDDALPAHEPRPAVARDRGALLRMFSSLRDG